ncbi:hypothetical protein DSO57_1035742 [Entomophthora muscae]|uniref:Uncharacterized protein n=1 Tax=Entomophthora muscae TaxID=34485 RepID=A0ACC2RE35_9FUNG|nr:hypothetical protein DSO57_1035742 [Entomophthora muscae]
MRERLHNFDQLEQSWQTQVDSTLNTYLINFKQLVQQLNAFSTQGRPAEAPQPDPQVLELTAQVAELQQELAALCEMMATAASTVGVVNEDGCCPGLPGAPQIQCARELIALAKKVDQLKQDHTELDRDVQEMNDMINYVNVATQVQCLDTTAQQSTQAFDTGARAVETLTTLEESICHLWARQPPSESKAEFSLCINVLNSVKIDNSSSLETKAQEWDSNPNPGFPQDAGSVDRRAARPCFFRIKPLEAEAPAKPQSQNTSTSSIIVALKEEPLELPNGGRDDAYVNFMSLKSSQVTNQEPTQERGTGPRPNPMTTTLEQDNKVAKLRFLTNERTPGPSAIFLPLDPSTQFSQPSFPQCPDEPPHGKC